MNAPPAEIFKAYDIRGIVDKTLTVEGVEQIGRALGSEAVDVLLHTLRFGRFRAREAVLPILVGLPVDPERLSALVDREIDVIRRLIVEAEVLRVHDDTGATFRALARRLLDDDSPKSVAA